MECWSNVIPAPPVIPAQAGIQKNQTIHARLSRIVHKL